MTRRAASPARRVAFAALALLLLAVARCAHAVLPTPALLARLRREGARRRPLPDLSLHRWAIAAAARRAPWRADCLVQALAAKIWLDALGIGSELRLGARRDGGALSAHAWLLADGAPVTGGPLSADMAPFAAPGEGGARPQARPR